MRNYHLSKSNIYFVVPTGWRSWFVDGLLPPRLWVRSRPNLVDFHDAENRQRPCRMIMRHLKNPLEHPFGLGALGKIKFLSSISHRQSSGELGVKITCGNWYRLYGAEIKKVIPVPGE
ncbi:hypothetical protein TNCV_1440701 [Trichonephila clavipes]|nr:hypothetical protein TNCV_1440701 [Trichonephila clavipes]